jgi:hypothetical protein
LNRFRGGDFSLRLGRSRNLSNISQGYYHVARRAQVALSWPIFRLRVNCWKALLRPRSALLHNRLPLIRCLDLSLARK